jgi:ASPIC and UnbV
MVHPCYFAIAIPGRHWVSFELAGTKSNRLALNARISIVAGGMTQTDEIHSGGSYLSQNDVRVHLPWPFLQNLERHNLLAIRQSGHSEQPGCRQVLLCSRGAGYRSV